MTTTYCSLAEGPRGGDCTWSGCVPSKILLKAAKSAQAVKDGARFGVSSPEPAIDLKTVMDWVDSVVREIFESESPETLQAGRIDVIQGAAQFINSFLRHVASGSPQPLLVSNASFSSGKEIPQRYASRNDSLRDSIFESQNKMAAHLKNMPPKIS